MKEVIVRVTIGEGTFRVQADEFCVKKDGSLHINDYRGEAYIFASGYWAYMYTEDNKDGKVSVGKLCAHEWVKTKPLAAFSPASITICKKCSIDKRYVDD